MKIAFMAVVLATLVMGCFDPELGPGGGYRCAGKEDCPPGQQCVPSPGGGKVCQGTGDLGSIKDLGKIPDKNQNKDLGKIPDKNQNKDLGKIPDQFKQPPDLPLAKCGDQMVTGAEQCDGTLLNGGTCAKVNSKYNAGKLVCGSTCRYDTTGCYGLSPSPVSGSQFLGNLTNASAARPRAVWDVYSKTGVVAWHQPVTSSTNNVYIQGLDYGYKPILGITGMNLTKNTSKSQITPDVSLFGKQLIMVYSDNKLGHENTFAMRLDNKGKIAAKDINGVHLDKKGVHMKDPAIACAAKANNCLVVWADNRVTSSYRRIHGVLLKSVSGNLTVSKYLNISSSASAHDHPDVASDGTNYVVVWHRTYSGGNVIQSKLVSGKGVVNSATYYLSQVNTTATGSPRIAYTGGSFYLAVWEDKRKGQYDIYGARLQTNANPYSKDAKSGFPIGFTSKIESAPDVACHKETCLVVNTQTGGSWYAAYIIGRRVQITSATTYKIHDSGITVGAASYQVANPTVVADANNGKFFVAWRDYSINKAYKLNSRILTP